MTTEFPADLLVLTGARLIDGTGGLVHENMTLVIGNGRFESVAAGLPPPAGSTTIDLGGSTVIPGLFDTHIHFRTGLDDTWKVKDIKVAVDLDMPMTLIGIKGAARARQALAMGFTTVRDAGDTGQLATSLRDAVASGIIDGPRIIASGEALSSTGGTTDFMPPWLIRTDQRSPVADGAWELRRFIRTAIKSRVDWIKFIATGTLGAHAAEQEFDDNEIAIIIGEAHRYGRPVFAHACYARGTLAIVRAGIDSVEHGCDLTAEIVDLMAEQGTFLVPTLSLFHSIVEFGGDIGIGVATLELAKRKLEQHVKSFQLALSAGVKIAAGSDVGSPACAHGTSAREIALLSLYGMSARSALETATRSSAELLRLEDDLGTISPGKRADLVVVDGDVLADLRILLDPSKIRLVIKDGAIKHQGGPVEYRARYDQRRL